MDTITLDKIEFPAVREILATFCATGVGRRMTLAIVPSVKLETIVRWQDETAEMIDVLRAVGTAPLGGIADITETLERAMPGCGAEGEDFARIASTLEAITELRIFLEALPEGYVLLRDQVRSIGEFGPDVAAIRRVVGTDGEILDSASPHLKKLRTAMRRIEFEVREVIASYLRRGDVRKLLTAETFTLHGDRYVLPVRADHVGRLGGGVIHRASHSGVTMFVEPTESVELNNRLVDLRQDERAEIERLLTDLSARLVRRQPSILTALRAAARVDLISAKAQWAYKNDMHAPEISPGGVVELYHARHPLLEWQFAQDDEPRRVVPIDVRLGGACDILVITGSNTGGKTVAMKTVALLVAMAHSGIPIPARRGAKLPLLEDVLIDIGDEQSLEQSLSTFGGHIERLKSIFHRLDVRPKQCLVLFDELGSGTDPDEGGAIGRAVLDELLERECLAMVSTHLSVLKAYAINHARVDNASVEFDTETLRPTYHLLLGTPGESHAITVADKLGMPSAITVRARKYHANRGQEFRKALRRTGQARQLAEVALADAAERREEYLAHSEALEQQIGDHKQLREEFAVWLATLQDWKPGRAVPDPLTGRAATLVRLELHRQIALLDIGGIEREVPLIELMPDLGHRGTREELRAIHTKAKMLEREAQGHLDDAQRVLSDARRVASNHKTQQENFDAWRALFVAAKLESTIPVNRKPGRAKLIEIDWAKFSAKVEFRGGEIVSLPCSDLFPQTGPFSESAHKGRGGESRQHDDKPIRHAKRKTGASEANKTRLAKLKPGEKVYVVPFRTMAKLVRLDADKGKAVVLHGAFEMEVKLDDVEPGERPTSKPGRGKK